MKRRSTAKCCLRRNQERAKKTKGPGGQSQKRRQVATTGGIKAGSVRGRQDTVRGKKVRTRIKEAGLLSKARLLPEGAPMQKRSISRFSFSD